MKFPISLSVTSANPDTDLPETKLCFLHVTECHKHFSCLLYHFNSSPPLLWLHAFFIIFCFPSSLYLSSVCSISRHEHAYLCVSAGETTRDGIDWRQKAYKKRRTAWALMYVRLISFIIYLLHFLLFYEWKQSSYVQEPLIFFTPLIHILLLIVAF